MNDIKFLQKYNETAIDNFLAVVKQNIVFQAQLAYLSEENQSIADLKKQIQDFEKVKDAMVRLQEENANLKNELNSKITIIESANKTDAEKYRLQTAVNTQLREIELLKQSAVALQDKLKEKEEYVAKLEDMLPKTARKKLGIITEEINQEETTVDNESKKTLSSGGDF
jgi:predicted RNase H-like nuclease (RuvC/YqgF family)